ncbi:hypothetical protein ACFQ0B_78015 [Nonomuraea thailandensis]
MEFLVNIEIDWPPETDLAVKEEMFAAELARGQELARAANCAGSGGSQVGGRTGASTR